MDPSELLQQASDSSPALLLWGMLYGSIGLGYFLYGKKQGRLVPLLMGVALSALPFFVTDATGLAASGAVCTALPYFLRGRF